MKKVLAPARRPAYYGLQEVTEMAKREPSAADRARWDEERGAKIEAAKAALRDGLRKLQTSEDWTTMLDGLARDLRRKLSPGRYSFGNQMLVAIHGHARALDVSMVATFKTWERHGRRVTKGERAITILQPKLHKFSREVEGADGATETREGARMYFRPLAVFALSQTDGEPIPEPPVTTASVVDVTTPDGFALSLNCLGEVALAIEGSPVASLTLRDRLPTDHSRASHGWYNQATRDIVVIRHESRAHEFHVAVHEVAHALLHPLGDPHGAPECEVEAESVSYVVCRALGLDASSFALPYVCTWASGDRAHEMVLRSGERITKAARTILDALLGEVTDDAPDSGAEEG